MRSLILYSLLVLALPLVVRAVPTGLNLMPTAEALTLGQSRFEFESDGSGKLFVPDKSNLIGSEAGVILGFEGGIDKLSNGGTVYNLKWVFKGDGLIFPALAVGAQDMKSGEKPQFYAVATKSVVPGGLGKLHAGVLRDHGETLTMIGASSQLGPLVLKADRVNGGTREGDAISAGIKLHGFLITGTRYNYTNAPDENTITLTYSYNPLGF